MQDELNTISPDHQDKLVQQFEYINDLIANDNIEKAVELLLELHYADLADFLDNVNRKYYHIIFPALASMLNSEVLVWLSNGNKQPAIEALGLDVSARLIDELDIEEATYIFKILTIIYDLTCKIINKILTETAVYQSARYISICCQVKE